MDPTLSSETLVENEWLDDYVQEEASYKYLFENRDEDEDEPDAQRQVEGVNQLEQQVKVEQEQEQGQQAKEDQHDRATQTDPVKAERSSNLLSIMAAVTNLRAQVDRVHVVISVLSWILLANMILTFKFTGAHGYTRG